MHQVCSQESGDLLDFRLALVEEGGVFVVLLGDDHNAACGALGGSCGAEVFLGGDVHVGDLLFLTKNWKVSDHINRRNVTSNDHNSKEKKKKTSWSEMLKRKEKKEERKKRRKDKNWSCEKARRT